MGNVSVNDGNVKLAEDRMSDDPGAGEFVLEARVGTSEGRGGGSQGRLTMGNGTGPVSESDPSHRREEREMMVEVTEEPADNIDWARVHHHVLGPDPLSRGFHIPSRTFPAQSGTGIGDQQSKGDDCECFQIMGANIEYGRYLSSTIFEKCLFELF